jgi:subtilisin family serine protease
MIRLRHTTRTAGIALMALTLARCSGDTGTSWIPRDGTISGVITATNAFLAPPRAGAQRAPGSVADRGTLAVPTRPASAAFARRMHASSLTTRLAPTSRAAATPNDLIVTFRHTALGAPPVGSQALAAAAGVRRFGDAMRSHLATIAPAGTEVVGVSPVILTAKIRVADTTQRDAIAAALRQDPAIAAVTRNRLIWLDDRVRAFPASAVVGAGVPTTIPNNLFYPFQSWHYGLLDMPRAWAITTGSASVLVAVVDNGIRFDHPQIAANLTNDGYTFVNNLDSLTLCATGTKISNADNGVGYTSDPTIPASYHPNSTGTCYIPDTLGGHGLHVAGTIGAVGNNGAGVTGVNWTVKIRPVRVLGVGGFGQVYDIAQGVLYAAGLPADNGAGGTVKPTSAARIINLSLGGPDTDATFHSAIVSAASAGALIVAAAGNGGSSTPFFPAAYPEVLAVAAVGPDGAPTPYSSFGSYVALRAPGGNFALGDASDGVGSTFWDFYNVPHAQYAFLEGTSMAAPHVSGVAALLLAQTPSLTAAALRTRLMSFAVGPATAWGAGLVNAYNSLTQSLGPPTQLYARLYSATTGAIVQTVPAQPSGAFTFTGVADGTYLVYAGTDEAGDQQLGIPGRRWGAFGGSGAPTAVTAFGPGPFPVSFSIGFPSALVPNHTLASATALVIGGYVQGSIVNPTTIDVYRLTIPVAGSYTFETSGWVADCGFALEEETSIGVYDASGTFITSAGSLDPAHYNYCSRLTVTLPRGTTYVGVAGAFGLRYRLQARAGS